MINKKNGVIIKYMEEVKIKLSFPLHVKKSIDIIQKIIKKINTIIYVVDSRVFELTFDLNILNKFQLKNKILIIFFNKTDLIDKKDKKNLQDFINNLESNINQIKEKFKLKEIYFIIGNKEKIKDLKNKLKEIANRELFINIVIIGYPNVGKSTIINRLINRSKAKVEDKVGTTRSLQWYSIEYNIKILDSPGIILPTDTTLKDALTLYKFNIISESFIPLPTEKIQSMLRKYEKDSKYNRN
ncbi:MAG: 50S ribosome-binding GTPase [bacterium]|nr:50S ribosome-binding GTPase [bacterium]